MANPEHVALVRQGAEAIREWRQEHPDERLDLRRANLFEAKLSGANLSDAILWRTDLRMAKLSRAKLSRAKLSRAILLRADLSAADLSGAELSKADLSWANLSEADLSGAELSKAVLSWANLSEADLRRTKLREANLGSAVLSGANLSGANLSGANLSGANLSGANLSGANLSGVNLTRGVLLRANLEGADLSVADLGLADLSQANLLRANLSGANLTSSDLTFANLFAATLTRADVSYADLSGANLNEAVLHHANLLQAELRSTSLGDVDLSQTAGLARVSHLTPSSVGIGTLVASYRGAGSKLTPDLRTFFIGAGVPPELLDALPGIVAEVKYYSCFISYGQPDLELATKLDKDLRAKGVSCWTYEMDKTAGERTWQEIGIKRREADKMVLLCSSAALVRDGVLKEIEEQIDENPNKMVPISLDDLWKERGFRVQRGEVDLKPFLMERNYADFANKPYEEALEKLLTGLRRPAVKKPRRKKS